jgi:hypothetical protein
LGYPYGRRFGSKIARASSKEGDGVVVGPVTKQVVKGVTTHIEAADGYVKEIWLEIFCLFILRLRTFKTPQLLLVPWS